MSGFGLTLGFGSRAIQTERAGGEGGGEGEKCLEQETRFDHH